MSGTLLLLGAAPVHLPDHLRVAEEAGWKVTACHDRAADRRDRMARELGARALADLPERSDWDAAIVCSETVHHAADIDRALDLGLPVFTEKPLAGSAAASVRLADRAEAAGARLVTNYFLRTNPGVRALRAALEADEIGAVRRACASPMTAASPTGST